MANTYTQGYVHIVFAVQNRLCIIGEHWKNELYKYITGIVQKNGHKMIIINGMPDHLHILVGMVPTQSLSGLVQDIKGDSSKWINSKGFVKRKFSWQQGFGAFNLSKKDSNKVINYILNQENHHKKREFHNEYRELLNDSEIEFDERFIFKPI